MANSDKTAFEAPEYDKLKTVDEVEVAIRKHKDRLVAKDLIERRIKAEKKEYVASMNEQLKELAEEREHEMGVLGALEDRKKQINAAVVVPLPKAAT